MRSLAALAAVAFASVSVACTPEPTKTPNVMHPVSEGRAAQLIARTFQESGIPPEPDRYVKVGKEHPLRLEVAAAGRKFGVAYLTTEDWTAFGDALPPRAKDDSLVVALGEGGTHILVLHAGDYVEDDMSAAEHTATTIAAYRRIQRDVRDFLHRAAQQGWQ